MHGGEQEFYLPRKSLGDRNRSQANKFYKLSMADKNQKIENLQWAEQSARQAILYDYTNFQNWEILLKLKNELGDESGIYALLEDLLSVLGKDSELISQLKNINIFPTCFDLFYSILKREPLDADIWWANVESRGYDLNDFIARCKVMDFRDRRSNVIFGRRLERVRKYGLNETFFQLMPYLLAHRPDNYELWTELGKHHESLKDYKNAWMCYDQVLQFNQNDKNKSRLSNILTHMFKDDNEIKPNKKEIQSFHSRLEQLTSTIRNNEEIKEIEALNPELNRLELKLKSLLESRDYQEVFFMSRSLMSEGEMWAEPYFEEARGELLND